nr:sulfite exporter TauE/SafE family protein [Natrialba taiwanensis]
MSIIFPAYLYAFVLGDPARGGISLGVLGIDVVPTLFAYGILLGSLDSSTRRRLHRVLGSPFSSSGTSRCNTDWYSMGSTFRIHLFRPISRSKWSPYQ